jgi:hypothetical protein
VSGNLTAAERKLAAQIAAHSGWANTDNRTARTQAGRDAFLRGFLDEAGGDPVKAESLRKAHFLRLALRSAQARPKAKQTKMAASRPSLRLAVTRHDPESAKRAGAEPALSK